MQFFEQQSGNGVRIATMPPASVSTVIPPATPVMVEDAMSFVALMDHVRRRYSMDGSSSWRELTPVEEGTYESALGALASYFQGKQSFERKPEVVEVMKGTR